MGYLHWGAKCSRQRKKILGPGLAEDRTRNPPPHANPTLYRVAIKAGLYHILQGSTSDIPIPCKSQFKA